MLEKKIEELTTAIKDLIAKLDSGEMTVKTETKPAKKAATSKPKAKAKTEAAKDNVEPIKKQNTEAPSKDDVIESLLAVRKEFDQDVMFEIMDEVADGARNIAEVEESQYADVIKACNHKIGEVAEAA